MHYNPPLPVPKLTNQHGVFLINLNRIVILTILILVQNCAVYGQEITNVVLKPLDNSIHYNTVPVFGQATVKHTDAINNGMITKYAGAIAIHRWNPSLQTTTVDEDGFVITILGGWELVKTIQGSSVLLGLNQTGSVTVPDANGWALVETLPPGQYQATLGIIAVKVNAYGNEVGTSPLKAWKFIHRFEMKSSGSSGSDPSVPSLPVQPF